MSKAILFDLDQTLLDTSPLAPYRDAAKKTHKWGDVLANLHLARRFEIGDTLRPDQLPAAFRRMGYRVAVVTSSIQRVAEGLLDRFGIPRDLLVAFHDTKEWKPYPAPLLLALERLGVLPSDAISVGDDWKDTHAAHRAEVLSVGAAWGVQDWISFASAAPDVTFHKPSHILKPELLSARGYIGELAIASAACRSHRGSLLWLGPGRTIGFCLGRYYPQGDPRHDPSDWSKWIIGFKDRTVNHAFVANMLIAAFDGSKLWGRCPYLISVPPKPRQANRFAQALKLISEQVADKITVVTDGLKCVKDYGSIKGMDAEGRGKAVSGAFESPYNWQGRAILLLDDVHTTAATTDECIATLKRANAGEVLVVALGKDQSAMERREHKQCPVCGRKMKVSTRRSDGQKFWGCTGFWDKLNQCRYTEETDPAVA